MIFRVEVYSAIGQIINVYITWDIDCIDIIMNMAYKFYGCDITFKWRKI